MSQFISGIDRVLDLSGSRGNGPFRDFRGVLLHVNVDERGTSDSFWQNNSGQVTPNFQVYKSKADGGIHQILPLNWQPWCQVNGNYSYAAIETAGMPDEPLTDYQIKACAVILKNYHQQMGMKLQLANAPGQYGFGTHAMGGAAYGGHACPGAIRSAQRSKILAVVLDELRPPAPDDTVPRLRHPWPGFMPPGEYFGLITGPNESHGGYEKAEQYPIKQIQTQLTRYGHTVKVDGIFGYATRTAVIAWQEKWVSANRGRPLGRIYRRDWYKLFTY